MSVSGQVRVWHMAAKKIQSRSANEGNRPSEQRLTESEKRFCELLTQGLTVADAERQMGWAATHGFRVKRRPRVRAHLDTLQRKTTEKETSIAATVLAKRRTVTRAGIIDGLYALATTTPENTNGNISGQVKAWENLAKIHGMLIERSADVTKEFAGRSEEDLEFFAEHGFWPNRMGTGESGPDRPEGIGSAVREPQAGGKGRLQ